MQLQIQLVCELTYVHLFSVVYRYSNVSYFFFVFVFVLSFCRAWKLNRLMPSTFIELFKQAVEKIKRGSFGFDAFAFVITLAWSVSRESSLDFLFFFFFFTGEKATGANNYVIWKFAEFSKAENQTDTSIGSVSLHRLKKLMSNFKLTCQWCWRAFNEFYSFYFGFQSVLVFFFF